MKRRFRITITPDTTTSTFLNLRDWIALYWGIDFRNPDIHFRGWTTKGNYFCSGIEVFDKTTKAL